VATLSARMASANANNPSSHVTRSGRLVATFSREALDARGCERARDDLWVMACFLVATCPPFRYSYNPEPSPSSPSSDYPGKAAANRRRARSSSIQEGGLSAARTGADQVVQGRVSPGGPLPAGWAGPYETEFAKASHSTPFSKVVTAPAPASSSVDPSPLPLTRPGRPLAGTQALALTVSLTAIIGRRHPILLVVVAVTAAPEGISR
jgi:hypothetical protein